MTREAAALDRAVAAAADPEVSNTSDATDRALDALLIAARETFIVIEEARQRASAACSSIQPPR